MNVDHLHMGQTFTAHAATDNGTADDEERQLVKGFMAELDSMRAAITDFPNRDPADILSTIAGTAGRLAEIRAQLHRSNSGRCSALRTREVDPLREDLDLQFRIWSRKIALLEWELKLSTGTV
jgi:hypothetical protein